MSDERAPHVHERDGYRWINRCPRCEAEAFQEDDYEWACENGHIFDMPNEQVLARAK